MGLEMARPFFCRSLQAFFLQVAPGLVAKTLALPERGIGKALGASNDDAIDVALQATVGRREAKLLAVCLAGAQVETCVPQPRHHAVLHDVTALEDAQQPSLRIASVVDGSLGVLELQRTLAGHAKTRSPEVLACGLTFAGLLHTGIDQRRDTFREA